MKIHHFDSVTHLYTQSTDAIENPRSPGKYLSQAFATFDRLPITQQNETAQRDENNTRWLVVEDYRGIAWHKETKEVINITETGPLAEYLTILKPNEFDVWNGREWQLDTKALAKANKTKATGKIATFVQKYRRKIAGV